MKKVLLLSLSLAVGFTAFAQQRVAKNDLIQSKAKVQKELAGKDKRIAELEETLRDYLKAEIKTLDEMESSLKQRRIKAESLLHNKLG